MSKWVIASNIGYGWEEVSWLAPFDTKEEAEEFLFNSEEGSWDGDTRVFESDEEDD